ncbi:hypothetical protein M2336_001041 [Sphingobium sp. B1D7B]|nr:hypothetical protein [Sphingobium sp. B1D7B]
MPPAAEAGTASDASKTGSCFGADRYDTQVFDENLKSKSIFTGSISVEAPIMNETNRNITTLCFLSMVLIMLVSISSQATASEVQVVGKVVRTQGHTIPSCRMTQIRRSSDGALIWLRIPDTGSDNSILAVALAALTADLAVTAAYDATIGTGCGTEPRINWIEIMTNN